MMLVLQPGQLFAHAVRVVIIDQGDAANHDGVRGCRAFANQAVANQVAKRLGAVGINCLRRSESSATPILLKIPINTPATTFDCKPKLAA
jgi:hypothetical protein